MPRIKFNYKALAKQSYSKLKNFDEKDFFKSFGNFYKAYERLLSE